MAEEEDDFDAAAARLAAIARLHGYVDATQPPNDGADEALTIRQLPLWPEPVRAAPNALLRSALFGIVKKGKRRYCKQEQLASWPDTKLAFTGEQLDQYDEDVWLQLVHLHMRQGIEAGQPLYVNAKERGFMREFGRAHGSKAAKVFYESVSRMEACGVHITQRIGDQEVEYIGGLVREAARVKGAERWAVVLNPKLLPYFAPGHHSRLDWEKRLELKADLAKWLQGYVASHQTSPKQPHRIGVKALRDLSRSGTELKDFRRKLKRAMAELDHVGLVFSWSITSGDALEFVRPPQRRELPEST